MITFDMGLGGVYNSDDSSMTLLVGLSMDYYVSDRVGIGLGFNAMWAPSFDDLVCILQPDLHIIIDM